MTTFTVDPAALQSFDQTLQALAQELSSLRTMVHGFDGRLGGRDLEGEVSHFMDRWHDGVQLIAGDLQKAAQHLGAAAKAYATSEGYVATGCEGGAQP